jgi:hypothetical protein
MYAARLGEKDEAFELLRKAVEERERELVFMRSLPAFIDMRSDPRFDAFLKRIGLSEEDIRNLP